MKILFLRTNIIIFFLFNLIISQNFIYESEDWFVLKNPGMVYSITEGPFNVFFGTENGIFKYDKFDNFIEYDFKLNQGLNNESSVYYIHYDNYSDQIWIVTEQGIFYKNPLFNDYQEVRHHTINSYNLSSIAAFGSINQYIVIQYLSDYVIVDSFSGTVVDDEVNIDINNVSWSASSFGYNSSEIDLSTYYADEWLIGFRQITDLYGNDESVIVSYEDRDLNLWFGTSNGKLLKGFKYSNKLDVKNIGPISNNITSIASDTNQKWYFATDGQSYKKRRQFNYNKQSNSFLSVWNEYEDSWFYWNQSDFPEISNPIINCIVNINEEYLALGTMEGVIISSLDNYKDFKYLNKRDGLNDNIIIDMEYYNEKIFIMTYKGISIYSLLNDIVIEKNILIDYNLQNSGMLDMLLIDDSLFFSSKAGLFQFNIKDRYLQKISNNAFSQIASYKNKIVGLNESLWIIDYLDNKEKVVLFNTNNVRNFSLFDNYVWLNLVDKVRLINLDSKEKWTYNHNDGFDDIEVFDLGRDGNWVYFLTDQGVLYYNWREYHH